MTPARLEILARLGAFISAVCAALAIGLAVAALVDLALQVLLWA